ncbi:hypothetical protein QNO07_10010 [Streptomyces sp. 549]|uniref:hypothetical protein n=1 Tax=Streptomyces sp. 549 TaxID=3049076 RepID=UPI0024C41875|nr:hypothetical protein [Streptomyces sp. 549]MDK1473751.1 hypothetical protein [Streptomyces sp. 549]
MSVRDDVCGACRPAWLQLPPACAARFACVLQRAHHGSHQDLTGHTWYVTTELAEALAVDLAAHRLRNLAEEARG